MSRKYVVIHKQQILLYRSTPIRGVSCLLVWHSSNQARFFPQFTSLQIGDFGTSRWTQHTMSTGLATFTTKSSKNTQMSLAWSAPEVRCPFKSRTICFYFDRFSVHLAKHRTLALSRLIPGATTTDQDSSTRLIKPSSDTHTLPTIRKYLLREILETAT